MKVYEFGKKSAPALLLLPGTCCHWKGNLGESFRCWKRIFEYSASAMTALMRRKTQSFRPCLRKQRK